MTYFEKLRKYMLIINLLTILKFIKDKLNPVKYDLCKIYEKLVSIVIQKTKFYSRDKIIILDDIFPVLVSAFRVAEYNTYLEKLPNVIIYSTATAFPLANEKRSLFNVIKEYESYYPEFKGRVLRFNRYLSLEGKLIYTIFLNNAYNFIELIDKYKTPFVFTLYPGGGFQINQEESDEKLLRVCSSPNLKKIIVTQNISYDYLQKKQFFPMDKVELIYGGVLPSDRLNRSTVCKKYYAQDKSTFDICFVAQKYMPKGVDKGYDIFIKVAKLLAQDIPNVFFHIVGTFEHDDIDVTSLHNKIKFYGTQKTEFFPEFYSKMDLILSPNRPFVLQPGAFDGFPTGCCIEAGLSKVAVFCTDILNQNVCFKNDEDIVIITTNAQEIYDKIIMYYNDNVKLKLLTQKGYEKFQSVFNIKKQMTPRLEILQKFCGVYYDQPRK